MSNTMNSQTETFFRRMYSRWDKLLTKAKKIDERRLAAEELQAQRRDIKGMRRKEN